MESLRSSNVVLPYLPNRRRGESSHLEVSHSGQAVNAVPIFRRVDRHGRADHVKIFAMGAVSGRRGRDPLPYNIVQAKLRLAERADEVMDELAEARGMHRNMLVTALLAEAAGVPMHELLCNKNQPALKSA